MEDESLKRKKNKFVKDMTEGEPLCLLFEFAIPLLIGNIFHQLYNLTDSIVVGNTHGRVRTLKNDKGENLVEAYPSMPVSITGLNELFYSHYMKKHRLENDLVCVQCIQLHYSVKAGHL